jgi:hypothetical protein
MTRSLCAAIGLMVFFAALSQPAPAGRTVRIKLSYNGAGQVDANHKILVFMFDSPDFTSGHEIPFATQTATAKNQTVTFDNVNSSPVYVVAVFDPKGEYDGQSPPPSGASLGLYSKTPGKPEPIAVDEGKTIQVDLVFDDSVKAP